MNKTALLLLGVIAASTPAAAQKITIDYARGFDFSAVETFQYLRSKESNAADGVTDNRIKNAIIRELFEGGLNSASSNPDLYVTYHITTGADTAFTTESFGYGGVEGGWGPWGGGMESATTTASIYDEGTLIVDAFSPDEKKMVWRGTGTVNTAAEPEEQRKQIDRILAKLGRKWGKILAGQGR